MTVIRYHFFGLHFVNKESLESHTVSLGNVDCLFGNLHNQNQVYGPRKEKEREREGGI